MAKRLTRLTLTSCALAMAAGCVALPAGTLKGKAGTETVVTGRPGASVAVTALSGTMKGPRPGVIADNAASVLSNNSGGLISNNGGGLISNHGAGYRVRHVDDLTAPAAAVELTVVDQQGRALTTKPAKTDKDGQFKLTGLKPAAGVVFIKASYQQEGHTVTLMAAVAVSGGASQQIAVDPATTLVAQKLSERLRRGELKPEAVKAASLAAESAAIAEAMSPRAVAAASILPPEKAAESYDAMLSESAELARAIAEPVAPEAPASAAPPTGSGAADPSARPSAGASTAPAASVAPASPTPSPAMRPNGGVVSTFAGTGGAGTKDGPGASATFNGPWGLTVDKAGNVLVCDGDNHRIRQITPAGVVSTLASGDFAHPQGIAVNPSGDIFVADRDKHRIAKVAPDGTITTFVGRGEPALVEGQGTEAALNEPAALVFDKAGTMYVADSHNHCIRKVTPDGRTSLFAGNGDAGSRDGLGTAARLNHPHGLAIDGDGNLYATEESTGKVRKIAPDGRVSTLAATFGQAMGVAVDSAGMVYVADFDRHVIRRIGRDGVAEAVVFAGDGLDRHADGTGTAASFDGPSGLAFDGQNRLYVTDLWNHRIRKVE